MKQQLALRKSNRDRAIRSRTLCEKWCTVTRRLRINSRSIRNDAPRDCRSNSFKEKLTEEGTSPLFVYNIEMLYMNRGRDVMSKFTVASNGSLETTLRGVEVLSTPLLNKGVAFTQEERIRFKRVITASSFNIGRTSTPSIRTILFSAG